MIQITINDNKEVEIKTTKGLEETKLAADIVTKTLEVLSKPKEYKLVLVSYSLKLQAVKEVKEILHLGLKEAKDLVDECEENNMVTLATGTSFEMDKLLNKFTNGIVQVKVIDSQLWLQNYAKNQMEAILVGS